MLLKDLLPNYNGSLMNIDINGITDDSRDVKEGNAFVCIKGPQADGHNFAQQAAKMNPAVIICEKDLGLPNQIIVSDTHEVFADMSAKWFGNPAEKLHLIGVTGTNGKTSTTYMIKKILEKAGHKVGLVGTIQNMIGERVIESKNTTPGIYDLNKLFKQMLDEGCDFAVMEVSSHALHQRRVCGFRFNQAVFTNLTQDHLDYHGDMESYFDAKKMLFDMCDNAIINIDDDYGKRLANEVKCKTFTYSCGNNSKYSAKNVRYFPASVEYELFFDGTINHISVNTGGKFTVYNSLAAAVTALSAGVGVKTVADSFAEQGVIKGRAEVVPTGRDFTVVIDYAHTPDGLKNILSAFKECQKNRLTVLFGCGGDRDKTKRPIMGSVAVRMADNVIVTSDNPRSENPMDIINEILVGTKSVNTPVKVIENRVEAIKYAIKTAQKNDIIVLAGKGHETYQILSDKTIHLDEREVVAEALSELKTEE